MPLSTTFQLYRGGQFFYGGNRRKQPIIVFNQYTCIIMYTNLMSKRQCSISIR